MVPSLFLASLSLKFLEVCIIYVLQRQLTLFFFFLKILTGGVIQKEIFSIFFMLICIHLLVKDFLSDEIKDFFIQLLFT